MSAAPERRQQLGGYSLDPRERVADPLDELFLRVGQLRLTESFRQPRQRGERRSQGVDSLQHPFVFQLVGGLRAGMGYVGTRTLEELRTKARFIQVSGASVQESHPPDIAITQESPNYSMADYSSSDGD